MEMINATGRRKASVARVYLTKGEGKILVNGKDYKQYFPQIHIQANRSKIGGAKQHVRCQKSLKSGRFHFL